MLSGLTSFFIFLMWLCMCVSVRCVCMNAGGDGGQRRELELLELGLQIGGHEPSNMSATNQTWVL